MHADYPARRERLLAELRQANVDSLLVSLPVNVTYLTGFSGDSSYLVLTQTRTVMVSDGRFTEQIAEECPGLEAHIRPPAQTLQQATGELLKKLGVRSVGFDSGHLTVGEHQTLRGQAPMLDWKDERGRVEKLRLRKDDWELAQIREAIRIAEKAFAMFKAMLRGDDTEKALADAMETYIRRAGGTCSAFPPIVASGPRAALPHAKPTARTVDQDGLLLVDWGAEGAFYKSDLTRVLLRRTKVPSTTAPARDAAVPDARTAYDVVRRAQAAAAAVLRPGTKACDVDAAARAVIADAGLGEYFLHSVGHGVGLQIHEGPALRPGSETVLEPGMVVTLEPGVYLAGRLGVRLEDDFLVTPDGCELLTSVPREYDEQWVDY